jgi:hypothetical protein
MSNPNQGNSDTGGEGDVPGEAQLLVSEFPPPPYYYHQASSLTPPTIPVEALERGTRRAALAAAKARAESTRLRLLDGREDVPDSDAILGGEDVTTSVDDGEVVAVFGEIVEVSVVVNLSESPLLNKRLTIFLLFLKNFFVFYLLHSGSISC